MIYGGGVVDMRCLSCWQDVLEIVITWNESASEEANDRLGEEIVQYGNMGTRHPQGERFYDKNSSSEQIQRGVPVTDHTSRLRCVHTIKVLSGLFIVIHSQDTANEFQWLYWICLEISGYLRFHLFRCILNLLTDRICLCPPTETRMQNSRNLEMAIRNGVQYVYSELVILF